ncbi:hypothetical protein EJB05_02567, partial [Eragrostis curvula]
MEASESAVIGESEIYLKLHVRVGSYFSLPDGAPKRYLQGKKLPPQNVAVHRYGILQLVNFVAEHYMWGSKQYISLWRSLENHSLDDHPFDVRRKIGAKMHGKIIPKIIQALNARSKEIKDHEVLPCGALTAEVLVSGFSHAVDLVEKTCSCRAWQVSGKPCSHALAFIAKLTREINMEDFVHEYYSVERFRKAYAQTFKPMTSKLQWPRLDLGFKIKKPKLRRKPGRPRVARIKASDETTTKKRKCTECGTRGHTAKYCQGGLTASQKKMRASQENETGQSSNEPNSDQPPM